MLGNGQWQAATENYSPDVLPMQRKNCGNCGRALQPNLLNGKHDCVPENPTTEEILAGQQRGRDYQKCPKCPNVVGLHDGCNHMKCDKCNADFCFCCGASATHESGHWAQGSKCPRYGVPGSENAIYDEPAPAAPAAPAAPLVIRDFLGLLVDRGNAHIEAGGVINIAFFHGIFDELGPAAQGLRDQLDNVFNGDDNVAQVQWDQFRELHRRLLEEADVVFVLPVIQDIIDTVHDRGMDPNDPFIDTLLVAARITTLNARIIAGFVNANIVPPDDVREQLMADHARIFRFLIFWETQGMGLGFPLLRLAIQAYSDNFPPWMPWIPLHIFLGGQAHGVGDE
jgi:hypothetical protein